MSSARITTIGQLLEHCYGTGMMGVSKLNAPVLTTTTGVYIAIYGAQAFSQLNNEANAFALLPKIPWEKSGWRVITADAGATADDGATTTRCATYDAWAANDSSATYAWRPKPDDAW